MLFLVLWPDNHIIYRVKLYFILCYLLKSKDKIMITKVEYNTRNISLVVLVNSKVKNKNIYCLISVLSIISFD